MSTRLNNLRYYFFSFIYDLALQWFYRPLVRRLIETVNAQPGEQVLEIGVGTGITIPFYAGRKQVTGIDCSLPMLQLARKKAAQHPAVRIALEHAAAEDFSSAAARFGQVVFCNSLSVIDQPRQVLSTYYAGLPPGGSLYILNHFTAERGPLRQLDKLLTPVGRILGFQSFFPLQQLLTPDMQPGLSVVAGGYWRIVRITKPALADERN
ncbi:class I SAM-dependent methyltransferase [Hymenobacter metallicola]|uniref:Class I SAM-dependent methyltransferase n=1 Tax=Hymenobacter metallicola TaxID=2563114 RepID=A0A4Z0QH27_9BACT|nr:class I SAM-dependent methyltransferase [Hymenobacter metallicola]TGE29330.1 class I SAM-dependent methyltransferase [Hymenobacter metallicola]